MKAVLPQRLYSEEHLQDQYTEVQTLSCVIGMVQTFMSMVKKYVKDYGGTMPDEFSINKFEDAIKEDEYKNGSSIYSVEDTQYRFDPERGEWDDIEEYISVSIKAPKYAERFGLYSISLFITSDEKGHNVHIFSIDIDWYINEEHKLETGMSPEVLQELYQDVTAQYIKDFEYLTR